MASVGSRPSEVLGFPSSCRVCVSAVCFPHASCSCRWSRWEPMRSPQRAEVPGTVCIRYAPLLPPLLSSDSCQCLPLPCINCSRQGQPPGHAHPPLRIPCPSGPFALPPLGTPYPFGLLHILHSVSLAALMHCPLGIPCLPGPSNTLCSEFRVPRGLKHTLHSKLQAPDTRWAPDSIQEGV